MSHKLKLTAPVVLLLALMFGRAVSSLVLKSPTYDEPLYLTRGYAFWKTGQIKGTTAHPPLTDQIVSLPLLFMDLRVPADTDKLTAFNDQFLYHNKEDADKIVFWGRMTIVVVAMGLGLCLFAWSKALYGPWAGLLALFLYSFDPNVLALSRLATTDIILTCLMFVTVYFFWQLLRQPTVWKLVSCGVFFGLAQATKASSLLLIPMLVLLTLGWILAGREVSSPLGWPRSGGLAKALVVLALIGLIGFVTLVAVYHFDFSPLADLGQGVKNHLDRLPLQENPTLRFLVEDLPLPASKYFYGFIEGYYNIRKHNIFFMGKYAETSWWYFYPLVFLMKTPIPVLLLLSGAGLLALWRRKADADSGHGFHGWEDDIFLIGPVVVYFVVTILSPVAGGYRYLLPVLPFLFVFISQVAALPTRILVTDDTGLKKEPRPPSRISLLIGLLILGLCLWLLVASAAIHPHYLAYFNELFGGPDKGYKYLVDFNLDWGQDLKGLKAYVDENSLEEVWLSYFGTANPDYYGLKYRCLPSRGLLSYAPCSQVDRSSYEKSAGVFAVSATNLQGQYFKDRTTFDWLKEYEPVAKIGYSIFIYNLLPAQAEEVRIGDNLIFNGYSLVGDSADGRLLLDLYWRSPRAEAEDYRLYLKLLNGVYQVWGQQEGPGIFFGSEWLRGRMVRERQEIEVWPGTPPGFYQIALSLYDPHDDRWLEPADRDEVLLGPVEIPPRQPPPIESLDIERWSGIDLGGRVQLLGYKLESGFRPGDNLHLTLFWEAVAELDEDYTVFVHLMDVEGRVWRQKDSQPASGFYPTTSWEKGEIVRDQYDVAIPAEAPPGDYRLEVGLYRAETGERLPACAEDGRRLPGDNLSAPLEIVRE